MNNGRYAKYNKECDLYNYRMSDAVKSHTTNTMYLTYRDICIEEGIEPVDRITYQKYFDRYVAMVIDRLINKGMGWEIPHNLGSLKIVGCEMKKTSRYVDWEEYHKNGVYTTFQPIGTNKYVYKFKWIKPKSSEGNIKKYDLFVNRKVKKLLVAAARNGAVYELDK